MPAHLTPRQIARQIIDALHACGSRRAAEQAKIFFKEPVQLVGVRAADTHRIARETYNRIKRHWQVSDAIVFCDMLMPDKRFEVKAVALLFCERYAAVLPKPLFRRAQGWIEAGYCDSWGLIDTLCPCVVGPLLGRYPDLIARTQRWTSSPNRWLRRAAAVSLIRHARKGHFLDETYATAALLLADRDDLVQKATGWLLREAGKTDRDRLRHFLAEHGPRCARTALRYAIEHFPKNERDRILRETRAGQGG